MFDTWFEYQYVNRREMNSICAIHLYRIKASRRQTIMVEAHEFTTHPICIVKFYDKDDRNSPNRFTTLTRKGNFSRIFRTCINIMLELKHNNPYMSFAFIGAPTPDEKSQGKVAKTQRYRIYEYGMAQWFSILHFRHAYIDEHSLYMIFNRDYCDDKEGIESEMLKSIQEVYPDEPFWTHIV